jgi:hypothetical protein
VTYPFDRDNPPEEPPARTDRLLWMVAFALRAEHEPGEAGFCAARACANRSESWPCQRRSLADGGLLAAAWPLVELPGRNRPNVRTYPDTGR